MKVFGNGLLFTRLNYGTEVIVTDILFCVHVRITQI